VPIPTTAAAPTQPTCPTDYVFYYYQLFSFDRIVCKNSEIEGRCAATNYIEMYNFTCGSGLYEQDIPCQQLNNTWGYTMSCGKALNLTQGSIHSGYATYGTTEYADNVQLTYTCDYKRNETALQFFYLETYARNLCYGCTLVHYLQ